ncbi:MULTISPECIES: DUF554 domain-containing protein [Clostridium]|uniref:DUF554 domain-containing protein n=1 Tax=Clostridium cibarium TaxID=2762247 RepID=A0ABR8PY96_9CLOT|nr:MULTISPECIES: DUF554 domain-containing protein [Clostridium]MBD7913128.1 DUF554 domain-containing protein [Clostridium cibarium]
MLGTIVNCVTIFIGCIVGLFIKGKITTKISNTIMNGLALCVLYIGISGALKGEDTIQMIICVAVGALIGEIIDIDKRLIKLGDYFEKKVKKKSDTVSVSEGFVTASLLFCIGAMAVVGSLESGLKGDNTTLLAKSVLDGISSLIFSSTLGIGVMLSVLSVLIYQGVITLAAGLLSGILSTVVISNMSAVGSLLIIGLGLNMLEVTKIKVANLLPAIFIPIIFGLF